MTRVLLDTNVLIHREASTVIRPEIGVLFQWLDRLHCEKCVHPASITEIRKHDDKKVVSSFEIKLGSYITLKNLSQDTPEIAALRTADVTENDANDTSILAEIASGRAQILITEDRGIHRKASVLGLADQVFTIDAFLEKVTAENPALADYRVLSIRKQQFGEVPLSDPFFDSFREDYPRFDVWFRTKLDEPAYVCRSETGQVLAFLYLKLEYPMEDYSDIVPPLKPAKRLKIGTLKVVSNGYKLGERFLKIVFDNALVLRVPEIYVTIFPDRPDHDRLIKLFEDWGFHRHGEKQSTAGTEAVYVKDFTPKADRDEPRRTYPFMSKAARKFVVPIWPAYHTELLPDSILRTESPAAFVENKPNRNAISKVYISRSHERDLRSGDLIVFYRTAPTGKPAYYHSVATTVGIVQSVNTSCKTKEQFIAACRKRSVFDNAGLIKFWDYYPTLKPFIVNFLSAYSLPKRPNLQALTEAHIIAKAPRGFEPITDDAFTKLLEVSNADDYLVVD